MENIESKAAIQISAKWGDATCEHPSFGQEINKSAPTGSFICLQCGSDFNKREMDEIQSQKN